MFHRFNQNGFNYRNIPVKRKIDKMGLILEKLWRQNYVISVQVLK